MNFLSLSASPILIIFNLSSYFEICSKVILTSSSIQQEASLFVFKFIVRDFFRIRQVNFQHQRGAFEFCHNFQLFVQPESRRSEFRLESGYGPASLKICRE